MHVVTLYTRRKCCLCHEALDVIMSVRDKYEFELREVDIDRDLPRDDPRLTHLAINIPVVDIDGEQVFEHVVDAAELAKRLASEAS